MRALVLLAAILLLPGCVLPGEGGPGPETPPARPSSAAGPASIAVEPFIDGLEQPVQVIDAGAGRFLVVEQGGTVRAWEDGRLSDPLLDLRGEVSTGYEQGLLSLAPDPEDAQTVYVSYTDPAGDTVLARYHGWDDPAPDTVLRLDQPYANHNGGLALFGPDGMLYFGLGDGGSGGDPQNNAQDLDTLLGKMLRIDVRGQDTYRVPDDNPFAPGGGRGEIWAYGLRNPWRFSFDRETGDLWIGDVGQNAIEEIDLLPHGERGANFGWAAWEGSERYSSRGITGEHAVFPVAEYTQADTGGCSVTGGHMYRGAAIETLRGTYVYADYCSGTIWGLTRGDGGAWKSRVLLQTDHRISSFGEDAAGELYVVDHEGEILRVVPAS